MSNKNPDSVQTFVDYIQQEKNSIYNGVISEDKVKEIAEKHLEREITLRNIQWQRQRFEREAQRWQNEMDKIWEGIPGGREAAMFRLAESAYTQEGDPIQPQNISYEDAKRLFADYDYYVENPIMAGNVRSMSDLRKRSPFLPYDNTDERRYATRDYIIFHDPEKFGYIRPDYTLNDEDAKKLYEQELNTAINEYNNWQNNNGRVNIDNFVDTALETYFNAYSKGYSLPDVSDNMSLNERLSYNTLSAVSSGIANFLKTKRNNSWDEYTSFKHIQDISGAILESLPVDNDDNVIINGYAIPKSEAYNQIAQKVGDKFGTVLYNDNTVNNNGLGRAYMNAQYKKEYGYTFDDYIDQLALERLREIRGEIKSLEREVVKEYTRTATNNTMAGMNRMGSLLSWGPFRGGTEAAVEKVMEKAYEQPFEDVLEEIDAMLASGRWKQFQEGFESGFDTTNLLSFGLNSVFIDLYKGDILDKVSSGKSLSEKEGYIYKLLQLESELQNIYSQVGLEKSTWASIGEGVGTTVADAPSFAIGMRLTSGIGSGVKYGTKYAAKRFIKQKTFDSAKKLAWTATKDLVKWSGVNYARGAVAAPLMSFTYKSYAESALKQYSFDENGNVVYTPKDKWGMALGAFIDGTNELASEHFGAGFDDVISLGSKAFGRATGISKWMTNSEIGTWMRRAAQSPMSAAAKNTLRNLGYTGVLSEPLSEVFGDFMSQSMRMGIDYLGIETEYDFSKFKTADYWLTTMGVSTIYGGTLTTVAAGRNIVRQANYAKKLIAERNQFLKDIDNEELRNTLSLLGNSDNFINSAIELADFNWDNVSTADKANAINYMRRSYVLQTTMGDMEGQRHMEAFEDAMGELYSREYTPNGKHSGRIYQAADSQANIYDVLDGNIRDRGAVIKVRNENGEILEIPNSELIHLGHTNIEDIMITEYDNRFSTISEMARLNTARQSFDRITNPSEKDIRRVTSEFGIRKPSVGKTVTLVDGTEATIEEDLQNGRYKIKKYNQETAEFEEVEIPVYDILSNNPISAAAQKKQYEGAEEAINTGNQEAVQEIYKSPEEKLDDIINGDYDSRLFDDKGVVKLDNQQIINNFSLEDPASLEDYINKVGSKVSPQVRQSLNNALKLSKIYNEVNPQLSHLVQTSKNRTDVAVLSNVLSGEIITSDPNITAEELLESIINNSNYNSKIRHDFKNILKALTNAKVQRRTTTKTTTSVTQKDVNGKRGRKQIEKTIKKLKEALDDNNPIEALEHIAFIDTTIYRLNRNNEEIPITDEERIFIEEAKKTLKDMGYEDNNSYYLGRQYDPEMKVIAHFIYKEDLPAGTRTIIGIREPEIFKGGEKIQSATIIVEQGPEIEEDSDLGEHVLHTDEMDLYVGNPESGTSDISQAVTKEMTGEEPMDFSEPTDNTVESKKEDSIPQTSTEQEFTIPELEKAFVIPDTDKLIETPSREEEVETLTDEQRREVTIQDSVNPNMREFKVDSILPDDITADEVIPDKHEVQGNRIYRYDGKQLREERKQVKRTPNNPNDEHGSFYKWLEDNNTDLQGIIDNELSEIAALDPDVKFMMLTKGTKSGYPASSKILNVVFQVVEYTDAIKKIHKESRGGIITSEGTKYLIIGTTGFKPALGGVFNPELNHYSFLADIVLKAARNEYTSSTTEVERKAYYVHPSMSTKIKDIQAGWITTQTENDSSVQERSLGELFDDETRNPHGIKIGDSKWLIPTKNESKPITVRLNPNDVVHGLQIPTGLAGAIFLLVPAANGHYIPISVKIGKTNELTDGKLKDAIWNTAQQLLDNNPDVRTQCIKDLCKILNLTKEGFNIFINNNDINLDEGTVNSDLVITSQGTPVYSVPLNTLDSGKLYELLFSEIPFQLNIGLQTLTTPSELKMYIESGALKTEAAVLGTVNASYTVHSIDTNLKADPYTEQPTDSQEGSHNDSPLRRGQGNGVIHIGNNQYFRYAEDSYVDVKTGNPVTDALTLKKIEKHLWLEKHKPTPAKIEKSGVKLYILSENEIMSVTKNGDISFITDQERVSGIIKAIQEEADNEVRAVNAKEELSRVEKQQQEEQIVPKKIQEENEASIPEVNFTEDFDSFKDTEVTPVEESFEEVSFETREEYTPKEKVSETFTEGVVENVGADQLPTTEFLRDIKKQLIKGGMSKKDASEIMKNVFNKLKEEGLESFYTSADESTIRSIVDIFTHCRNK